LHYLANPGLPRAIRVPSTAVAVEATQVVRNKFGFSLPHDPDDDATHTRNYCFYSAGLCPFSTKRKN